MSEIETVEWVRTSYGSDEMLRLVDVYKRRLPDPCPHCGLPVDWIVRLAVDSDPQLVAEMLAAQGPRIVAQQGMHRWCYDAWFDEQHPHPH